MPPLLLVLARTFHIGGAMLLFGLFFFERFTLRVSGPADEEPFRAFARRLARWAFWVLLIEWLSGILWLFVATSRMTEADPWYAIAFSDLQTVLGQTQFGRLWLLRACLALALTAVIVTSLRHPRSRLRGAALLLSCALLITLAWAGHAGAGHDLKAARLSADALHLFTGAVWPLGLIPLALFLAAPSCRQSPGFTPVVRRFSRTSLIAVGLLILTGIVNGWFLVGSWINLFETFYGRLLCGKIILLAVMIALGAANRLFLAKSDKLPLAPPAVAAVRRNLLLESLLAAVVLVVVGLMGATPPPH
jgi:putative copper resistance protein D